MTFRSHLKLHMDQRDRSLTDVLQKQN